MENTFTYTAREINNPQKMATFTLQNGDVSVQLGNVMLEQIENSFNAFHGDESNRLTAWIEPTATGALQSALQPISITDFEAQMKGDTLQTIAWIRAGGLRLAPILTTWSDVDNPTGARAFVKEINARKEEIAEDKNSSGPLDYWATWLFISMISIILPFFWWQKWQQRQS